MLDTIIDLAIDAATEIGEAIITKKIQEKKTNPDKTGKPSVGTKSSFTSQETKKAMTNHEGK